MALSAAVCSGMMGRPLESGCGVERAWSVEYVFRGRGGGRNLPRKFSRGLMFITFYPRYECHAAIRYSLFAIR